MTEVFLTADQFQAFQGLFQQLIYFLAGVVIGSSTAAGTWIIWFLRA